MMRILRQLSLALPMIALPVMAHAGVVVEMEMHDFADKSTTTTQTFVDGKYLKTQVRQKGHGDRQAPGKVTEMIYHPATSDHGAAMLIVDNDAKTYRVMDDAMMQQLSGMMGGSHAGPPGMSPAMMDAMKDLTPEQRAMAMQAMQRHGMGGMPGAAPKQESKHEIRATGQSDSVNGISCKIWEEWEDGVKSQEICAASAGAVTFGDQVMPAFMDMAQFMKKLLASMPMARQTAGSAMEIYDEIKGFPVRTRTYDNGKLQTETVFKGTRSQSLAASFFEAPAGYKREDMIPRE